MIVTSKPTFDYNALAAIMGPGKNISIPSILYLFGGGGLKLAALECTAKAISHRISKLREIAKNFDMTVAATQTPVKRVRKLKDKLATSNDDEDDDDEKKSPTKKRKIAPPPKTGKPKETLKISKPGPEDKEEDEGGESS